MTDYKDIPLSETIRLVNQSLREDPIDPDGVQEHNKGDLFDAYVEMGRINLGHNRKGYSILWNLEEVKE